MMPTKDYLNSLFEYKDGNLYWKISKGAKKAGSKAGTLKPDGCLHICIDKKMYLLHRIIFMMNYGYLPKQIDHIDGNRSNNHIDNLRPATHSQNAQNAKVRKDSINGLKNIKFNQKNKTWDVRIQANKTRLFIGSFKDLELAELVAMEARNKYHNQFARHGNVMADAKAYVASLP